MAGIDYTVRQIGEQSRGHLFLELYSPQAIAADFAFNQQLAIIAEAAAQRLGEPSPRTSSQVLAAVKSGLPPILAKHKDKTTIWFDGPFKRSAFYWVRSLAQEKHFGFAMRLPMIEDANKPKLYLMIVACPGTKYKAMRVYPHPGKALSSGLSGFVDDLGVGS